MMEYLITVLVLAIVVAIIVGQLQGKKYKNRPSVGGNTPDDKTPRSKD
jgi:hypothetical protein